MSIFTNFLLHSREFTVISTQFCKWRRFHALACMRLCRSSKAQNVCAKKTQLRGGGRKREQKAGADKQDEKKKAERRAVAGKKSKARIGRHAREGEDTRERLLRCPSRKYFSADAGNIKRARARKLASEPSSECSRGTSAFAKFMLLIFQAARRSSRVNAKSRRNGAMGEWGWRMLLLIEGSEDDCSLIRATGGVRRMVMGVIYGSDDGVEW